MNGEYQFFFFFVSPQSLPTNLEHTDRIKQGSVAKALGLQVSKSGSLGLGTILVSLNASRTSVFDCSCMLCFV